MIQAEKPRVQQFELQYWGQLSQFFGLTDGGSAITLITQNRQTNGYLLISVKNSEAVRELSSVMVMGVDTQNLHEPKPPTDWCQPCAKFVHQLHGY